MLTSTNVVVAGAGPGGAATALLLARAGARVTLLERAASRAPVGAALLLQPNGLAVLHALGFESTLADVGHRVDAVRLLRGDGRPISEVPVPDLGPGLDHLLAVRRADLDAVLLDAVGADPAIRVIRGAEVVGLGAGPEVEVIRDGERERVAGDLVVGADGVHSAVRSAGDFGARQVASGLRYARALVDAPAGLRPAEHWSALGLFGCTPLRGGAAYWYADVTHGAVADVLAAGDLAGFQALWRQAVPDAGALVDALTDLDDLLVNDVTTVSCRRFVDGNRVLVGDAAHSMAPTLGQGANSALVDAAVLSLELRRSETLAAGLSAYDDRRRTRVQRVTRDSLRIARLSRGGSTLRRAARDGLVRMASRSATGAARRMAAAQQESPAELHAELSTTGSHDVTRA